MAGRYGLVMEFSFSIPLCVRFDEESKRAIAFSCETYRQYQRRLVPFLGPAIALLCREPSPTLDEDLVDASSLSHIGWDGMKDNPPAYLVWGLGPGSFTGIRLAEVVVKTLSMLTQAQVLVYSSHRFLGYVAWKRNPRPILIIDKAPMGRYYATFFETSPLEAAAEPMFIEKSDLDRWLVHKPLLVGRWDFDFPIDYAVEELLDPIELAHFGLQWIEACHPQSVLTSKEQVLSTKPLYLTTGLATD